MSVTLSFWPGPAGKPAINAANTLTIPARSFWRYDKDNAGLVTIQAAYPAAMSTRGGNILTVGGSYDMHLPGYELRVGELSVTGFI
jgi:hypothetical protein